MPGSLLSWGTMSILLEASGRLPLLLLPLLIVVVCPDNDWIYARTIGLGERAGDCWSLRIALKQSLFFLFLFFSLIGFFMIADEL